VKIGEFFAEIGINVNTTTIKDFAKSVGEIPLDVGAAIAALAGIDYELTKVAAHAIEAATGFSMFSAQTGLSWQELQRWQRTAEFAGISAQSVASSVEALQANLVNIRLGRGNISPFQMTGINPNQDAFGILRQFREWAKGKNKQLVTNIGREMGLGPDMMSMIQMSDKEFTKFFSHVHGMTVQEKEDFDNLRMTLARLHQTFTDMLTAIVSHFTEAIDRSMQFVKILKWVGAGLALVAAYFFPVTAAIIGLILVLDDLAVYFTGGNSLFGLAIEGIKKFGLEIAKSFGGLTKIGRLPMMMMQSFLPGMAVGAMNSIAAGTARNMTVNQTNHTTIHSTADPHELKKEFERHTQRQHRAATRQFDNGGY
jgi:hypothetical protein